MPTPLADASFNRPHPWNKGRLVGQKRPLAPKHVWSIRVRLEVADDRRGLALFNLAIDSKLRACDLVTLKVKDIFVGRQARRRAASHCCTDRRFDLRAHEAITVLTTGNSVGAVANLVAVGERNRTIKQIESPQQPGRQNVLIIKRFRSRLCAADKAAMPQTDVIDKALCAEEDNLSARVLDRTIWSFSPHETSGAKW